MQMRKMQFAVPKSWFILNSAAKTGGGETLDKAGSMQAKEWGWWGGLLKLLTNITYRQPSCY